MALPKFDYHAPLGAKIACELVNDLAGARFLAGGTWCLNQLKKSANTDNLIGIKNLPELKGIAVRGDDIVIGAAETLDDISRNPLIIENFPILQKAINKSATPQIRNMATIGGNICTCLPWADLPAVLLALDAKLIFLDAKETSIARFLSNPKKYCAKDLLTTIAVSAQRCLRYKYLRLPLRNQTDIPFGSLSFIETAKGRVLTANLGNHYPVLFTQTAAVLPDKAKAESVFSDELKAHQKDELRFSVMNGLFKDFVKDL